MKSPRVLLQLAAEAYADAVAAKAEYVERLPGTPGRGYWPGLCQAETSSLIELVHRAKDYGNSTRATREKETA